jgi:hypothetical protein
MMSNLNQEWKKVLLINIPLRPFQKGTIGLFPFLKSKFFLILTGGLMVACSVSTKKEKEPEGDIVQAIAVIPNPPGATFNLAESDPLAIKVADDVMHAMGGRDKWDETRFLTWNFFDSRILLWDKFTGNVRIDFLKQDLKILMNIRTMEGKVQKMGQEMTQQDSVQKYLERGKSVWINDSYWLVMPFKLKDSGVTLKYMREDTTLAGEPSDVLQLTFQEVGDTPENKYEVWVDRTTKLVNQWAYYSSFEDVEPRFVRPWANYQKKGNIMLSDERGERDLKDVKVLDSVPADIFSDFNSKLN